MPDINNLTEVDAMLAERVKEWTHEWEAKGLEKGKAEVLLRQIQLKFGKMDAETTAMIQSASTNYLHGQNAF